MHRRVMPGNGTFELKRFATTPLDFGWSGTVSVEVLNVGLRRLPAPEFAYRTAARNWR